MTSGESHPTDEVRRAKWMTVAEESPAHGNLCLVPSRGSGPRPLVLDATRRQETGSGLTLFDAQCDHQLRSKGRNGTPSPTPKASALTYASQVSGVRRPSRSSQRPFIIALIETSCAASKPWRNAMVRQS